MEESIAAIKTIIELSSPRQSERGRRQRDKLIRTTIKTLKEMMLDKRVNRPLTTRKPRPLAR